MRLFVELPTWLGDAVMASAAVENIVKNYPRCEITFFGSKVSCELFANHPNAKELIINKKKIYWIIKTALNFDEFDIALSFRSHVKSKILLFFLKAKKKFFFSQTKDKTHQTLKYLNFVNSKLELQNLNSEQKIYLSKKIPALYIEFSKKLLGLNPGANYGSAKRWYPEYFAYVASELKNDFSVIIFGSKNEREICNKIANILEENGVVFYNLCEQTNISELSYIISKLNLFITNDSGPMHIASSFKIPTIALFGPTNAHETSPYQNQNAKIISLNLKCSPCMKRVCPINSHNCMKDITPELVLKEIDLFKEKIWQ